MRRQYVIYGLGMFLAGTLFGSLLFEFSYGSKFPGSPLFSWVLGVALTYAVVAYVLNVLDRRRK